MQTEALLYGDALFETVCVKDGQSVALSRHLRRFTESAEFLGFPTARIQEGLTIIESLHTRNEGLWRVTVARDSEGFGDFKGGVLTVFRPLVVPVPPTLTLCPNTYFPDDPLAKHKTTNYGRNMLARRHAKKTGYDDSLMVSSGGRIGEASMANAFFVFHDHVATPPLNGILSGTRRAAILEFMEVKVREVFEHELHDVVGIVLTSAAGIRPAASIQGRPLEVGVIERFKALQAFL